MLKLWPVILNPFAELAHNSINNDQQKDEESLSHSSIIFVIGLPISNLAV
jgi:hypothetical protein